MKTVGISEAKAQFSELLNSVQKGETFTVTRRGVAVAHIVPVDNDDAVTAMEELNRFRRERRPTLDGTTIRDLVEEGRE